MTGDVEHTYIILFDISIYVIFGIICVTLGLFLFLGLCYGIPCLIEELLIGCQLIPLDFQVILAFLHVL